MENAIFMLMIVAGAYGHEMCAVDNRILRGLSLFVALFGVAMYARWAK